MSYSLKAFFFIGRPLSPLYSVVMKIRETLYKKNILKSYSFPVPVISVGNLVMGGTGKTPIVRHLSELLQKKGYNPAVISRGYGGKSKQRVNVVSDGTNVNLAPIDAGDEPYMLARTLKNIPVLTGTRRYFPCNYAINKFKTNVLLLDDGFQHLSVQRNLDLVLFDATALAGNSRVFPGGELREPVSALKRCHVFLITGVSADNKLSAVKFQSLLKEKFPNKPVFLAEHDSYQLWNNQGEEISAKKEVEHYAFCGIANPLRFKNSLENHGLKISGFEPLKDHVCYTQSLVTNLCERAGKSGAKFLLTTEKDFVKLKNFQTKLPLIIFTIRHKVDIKFDDFILNYISHADH